MMFRLKGTNYTSTRNRNQEMDKEERCHSLKVLIGFREREEGKYKTKENFLEGLETTRLLFLAGTTSLLN